MVEAITWGIPDAFGVFLEGAHEVSYDTSHGSAHLDL
jgi:hypothetical protein